MKAQDHIPTLQATAALLLPGMKHARSLLDVSIRVVQYFESHAARDAAIGTRAPISAEKDLMQIGRDLLALDSVRLHLRALPTDANDACAFANCFLSGGPPIRSRQLVEPFERFLLRISPRHPPAVNLYASQIKGRFFSFDVRVERLPLINTNRQSEQDEMSRAGA